MAAHKDIGQIESRLRDIQLITDAALSHLADHDFLYELLDRTKAVLSVEIAALMLLDRSSGILAATAAIGLEEEVLQGVRVPLGVGFAGRIAQERRPIAIDYVDQSVVSSQVLIEKGVKSLLGVPLIASGTVIGVLYVGSLVPRGFTSEETHLLLLAADRAAGAVQSLRNRDDRVAAAALQRSLVPASLPTVAGAEVSARYVPGRGAVGGDWYDVFRLPSGELGVVIGDIAGSGLHAAIVMGRFRSALRAYALETLDPAAVLGRLDRKIQHFEPRALATVLYAVFDADLSRVCFSSAGHFPPVIAAPGRPARLADIKADLMIGVLADSERNVTSTDVAPGTTICFYTDGLVERRDEPISTGMERLRQAVRPEPADAVCAAVMHAMAEREPPRDDIALLVLRRT